MTNWRAEALKLIKKEIRVQIKARHKFAHGEISKQMLETTIVNSDVRIITHLNKCQRHS